MRAVASALVILTLAIIALAGLATVASADPPAKTDAFVCPVLGGKAGQNGMHKGLTYIGDGVPPFYTVVGPEIRVPTHATNGGGLGVVHGAPHAAPGDTNYTAIWNKAAQ